jgi:hypothetical protein
LFFKPNIHRKLNYSKQRERESFVVFFLPKKNRVCQNELLFIAQKTKKKKKIYIYIYMADKDRQMRLENEKRVGVDSFA